MSNDWDVVRRWVCPRCGPLFDSDARKLATGRLEDGAHTGCPGHAVLRTYVATEPLPEWTVDDEKTYWANARASLAPMDLRSKPGPAA